jgi:hypothetical protein
MSDRPLNQFQHEAQRRIQELVALKSQQLVLTPGGQAETYLTGTVVPSGIDVWIYEDELQFKGSGRHLRLERPDFPKPEQMLAYFLQEFGSALS